MRILTALPAHRRSGRGAFVVSPRFEGGDLHDYKFSEGLAAVKLEGRWGYIDRRVFIDTLFGMSGGRSVYERLGQQFYKLTGTSEP